MMPPARSQYIVISSNPQLRTWPQG